MEVTEITIGQISALIAIGLFFILFFRGNKMAKLSDMVMIVVAGGMLPMAGALILLPFCPWLIHTIEKTGVQFTITGLILTYIYLKIIMDKWESGKSKRT